VVTQHHVPRRQWLWGHVDQMLIAVGVLGVVAVVIVALVNL
jgi:hypothetical protein